jgi:hypothetical protein
MLTDKVIVITGASSGIGAALARRASREGASVVLAARRRDRLTALADELRSSARSSQQILSNPCDVSVRSQAENLINDTIAQLGQIDVLINNAGRGHFASIEETSDDVIQSMFALNVFALWYTTRPVLPHMKSRGMGHIINVASIAGRLGFAYNSAYVAAKHAVVGFTHALRLELVGTGIHATVACPAGVATEWASVTEGAPMDRLFELAAPLAKQYARDREITLPDIEGQISPEQAAERILRCIDSPVPELYTHGGVYNFLVEAARDRSAAEQRQIPSAVAERVIYEELRQKP